MTGTQGFGAYVSVTEIDTQDKTRGLCNITMVVTQPDLVASQQLHTTQTNNIPGMISVALLLDKYSNTCQKGGKEEIITSCNSLLTCYQG